MQVSWYWQKLTNRLRLFHKKLMVACLKFVMPSLMKFSQLNALSLTEALLFRNRPFLC
ncbi:hypothetical protein EMIT0347P_40581 [Pseudomonas sp. IT-347P]